MYIGSNDACFKSFFPKLQVQYSTGVVLNWFYIIASKILVLDLLNLDGNLRQFCSCIYCVSFNELSKVTVVTHLVKTSKSMRCYLKGTNSSPLVQFSGYSEDKSDSGDGGGIPVFVFWPISWFGKSLFKIFYAVLVFLCWLIIPVWLIKTIQTILFLNDIII